MKKLSRVVLIGILVFTVSWALTACKDKAEKTSEEASKEEISEYSKMETKEEVSEAPLEETTSEYLKTETKEAMETAGEFLDQGQKEHQEAMAEEIAGIDKLIEGLKVTSHAVKNEKKAEYQTMIQELTEKRDIAQKKMEELKEASRDTWQDIKNELDAALEDLKKTYDETVAKFEE
ncbi:MAG: hypothetical protein JRI88_01940 [Deltaproteobacteria bacterium]|nr:hypothetical protein [Deltaproteobacteria bacterium]